MANEVLFELDGGVALLTLNRPERRNAINQALLISLFNYLDEVENNKDIKVAIITGSGKAFCSGLDLEAIVTENLSDPRCDGKDFADVIRECGKPIIGAVNGYAITGGFEFALNCDFLIASEEAKFLDTHAKVGIHPGWGMTQLLQKSVGQRMAKQISFTCQPVLAAEALRIGLVNEVVAPDRLIPRAKEIAANMCAVNYDILMKMKRLMENADSMSINEAFEIERRGMREFIQMYAGKR